MANGGWQEVQDEWDRREQPLLAVDPVIEAFAAQKCVALSKNLRDWPERSLTWGGNPRCLIQLYLADPQDMTWILWICCSEDRGRERYWRRDRVIDGQPLPYFADRLSDLLESSYDRLDDWKNHPDQLKFATTIATMP